MWPPNQYSQPFQGHLQTCAEQRKFESPNTHCPRIYLARQTLLSCFSSHKQVSFLQSCLVPRFHIFVLFVGNAVVKNAHRFSTEMLSSVSKCKKAVMCILEKICVIDKPDLGTGYNAVGYVFSVNELTIYM